MLTTVNALVQRVPPRRLFDGRVLTLGPGGRIPLDRLQSFFRNNGYFRTDTVREPGEYAVRGGIVDLYPSGAAQPIRLDFFGDTLESLRSFDPLTQRSTGALDRFVLRPVSEVLLDDAAIQPVPLALPRGVRRGRQRRPALRIGQRRAAPGRHGALAAVLLRDAGDAVRLPARRGGVVRLPGRGGARPPARIRSPISMPRGTVSPAASAAGRAAPRRSTARSGPKQMFLDEAEWQRALAGRAVVQLSPFPDAGRRAPTPTLPSPGLTRGCAGEGVAGGLDRCVRCRGAAGAELRRRARRPQGAPVRRGARLPDRRAESRQARRDRRL